MLENQLLLVIGVQNHGILIEGTNTSGKFDPAEQINRDNGLVFAGRVEK